LKKENKIKKIKKNSFLKRKERERSEVFQKKKKKVDFSF
jgi:hypothetical protein